MCNNKRSVIRYNYKQRVVNMRVSALLCHLPSLTKGREEAKYVCLSHAVYHCLIIVQLLVHMHVYTG